MPGLCAQGFGLERIVKNGFGYRQKLRVVAAVNEWPNEARFENWHRAVYAAS